MLKKRIIPCLDIDNGRTVKGVNFVNLQDAGDPVELAAKYSDLGADELAFLDITATNEKRKLLLHLVERVAEQINIPFTVGGGISSVDIVGELLKSGADKVSINSAALSNPKLLRDVADKYGNQCVVLAIDTNFIDNDWYVYVQGGRKKTEVKLFDWVQLAEKNGAGEILLTSMQHDGTRKGFAIELINQISTLTNLPIIASGGAGTMDDFAQLFQNSKASAALAAGVFHYGDIPINELKNYLNQQNIPIRC
jgi:cyclase